MEGYFRRRQQRKDTVAHKLELYSVVSVRDVHDVIDCVALLYEKGKSRNSVFAEKRISGTTSAECQNIAQE